MSRDEGVIERELFIKAPPETVFKFLSDARLMAHWLGSFQEIDPQCAFRAMMITVSGAT